MNFIAQVEDHLRDLGAEARKKHPGVKEASERAILQLRTLQNLYVAQVRRATAAQQPVAAGAEADGEHPHTQDQEHEPQQVVAQHQHPTTALFQSQDLLRPFLLAANYPNASTKLLDISFRGCKLLIEGNAICPGDGIHLVRVWTIQANVCASQHKQYTAASSPMQKLRKHATNHNNDRNTIDPSSSNSSFSRQLLPPAANNNNSSTYTTITGGSPPSTTSSWFGGLVSGVMAAGPGSISNVVGGGGDSGGGNDSSFGVSSSSGTTGDRSTSGKNQKAEHERLAMEILGCLISLLELHDLEEVSEDQWSSSVALCCVLLAIPKGSLRQAAKSTLQKVISLLYETNTTTHTSTPTITATTMKHTWEDLLTLVSEEFTDMGQHTRSPTKRKHTLKGAFSNCGSSQHNQQPHKPGYRPLPPSGTLCLELLHQIMTQQPQLFHIASSTAVAEQPSALGDMFPPTAVTFMQLLRSEQIPFAVLWRSLQMVRIMILSQMQYWKPTCRELLLELVHGVTTATEACRENHDFEDGYVYTTTSAILFVGQQHQHQHQQQHGGLEIHKPTSKGSSSAAAAAAAASRSNGTSLLPDSLLWKAALVLEILLQVLRESTKDVLLEEDGTLVAIVTEAVSDFATIAASCKENILQVVECAMESYSLDSNGRIEPFIFQRAEEIGKSLDAGIVETAKGSMTLSTTQGGVEMKSYWYPYCDIGESVWIAFHCLLLLSRSLRDLFFEEKSDRSNVCIVSFMNGSFSPCLAVFQHYVKRFSGSRNIIQCTLDGYTYLAEVAVPDKPYGTELQRQALLSSLCKLSLPSWGKHDSGRLLQDHHLQALVCLLKIIHNHYDRILSEWHTVMWTLEELSTLSISSPNLSNEGYKTALTVSEAYARIAPLTACISLESLQYLVEALADIVSKSSDVETKSRFLDGDNSGGSSSGPLPLLLGDKQGQGPQTPLRTDDKMEQQEQIKRQNSTERQNSITDAVRDTKESLSGKFMSLAGRAISVTGMATPVAADAKKGGNREEILVKSNNIIPLNQRTRKIYYEDYRKDVLSRLASFKQTSTKDNLNFRQLPFSLIVLTDTAMSNSFRFNHCGVFLSKYLCSLSTVTPDIRNYAMGTLTLLISSQLSQENIIPSISHGPQTTIELEEDNEAYLAVEQVSLDEQEETILISHQVLLTPLCDSIRTTDHDDVAESGILSLLSILEGTGHNVAGTAWTIIIGAISALSGDISTHGNVQTSKDRSGTEWSTCSMLAFRCLKLIVEDFLDQLPLPTESSSVGARTVLLDCCSSFGSSRHDVNTSLTAIGLLWTIADQDPNAKSVDRALAKMVSLSSDSRTEVRNCSVNTLFSCIVGRGQKYSAFHWKAIICGTIFGVFDNVSRRGTDDDTSKSSDTQASLKSGSSKKQQSRYKVSVHHSRDSVGKQWATTEALVIRGVNRVFRNFFSQLLRTMDTGDTNSPWFENAWKRILDYSLSAATQVGGRDTLELRKCGVELLLVCCQLSCSAGIAAAITPARVGTNMEVVNGALRSVGDANSKAPEKESSNSGVSDRLLHWRQHLFLESFGTLDVMRSHFESNLEDVEEHKSHYIESVQLQVLHSLCTGLTKLYDCCKDDELSPGGSPSLGQNFEERFVGLLSTIAKKAAGDPGSKFLTQAQRACFDLLRCMTSNCSSAALIVLASLASQSFFWAADDAEDEFDPIEKEAAKFVAVEVVSESLSHESKVTVLSIILSAYVSESATAGLHHGKTPSYNLLIPVVQGGLESAAAMEDRLTSEMLLEETTQEILDTLWMRLFSILSHMLSQAQNELLSQNLQLTTKLIELVATTIANVPERKYDECCSVLSVGASNAVKVAIERSSSADNKIAHTDSIESSTSTNRLDDIIIFKACFDGLCKLQPTSAALRSVTRHALKDAWNLITGKGESDSGSMSLGVELSLIVCETLIASTQLESLVLAVFRHLCLLTGVNHSKLRKEVGMLLASIDLANVLETSLGRAERAEARAEAADERILELETDIDDLRDENENLQQQVAVFSASSALS